MRVGDEVASDDVTKACAHIDRPVTQLHKNWTKRLIHISISSSGNGKADGELQATGEHPIWTQNRGWVNAKDLVAGDKLLDPKGKEPAVVSVTSVPTVTATYNLSIEGTHAFFVMAGKTPVLVHNTPDVELHHPWPMYLGGPERQTLIPMSVDDHLAYHNFLNSPEVNLPKNVGADYYKIIWAANPQQQVEDMRAFRDATQAFDETYGTNLLGAAKAEGAPIPCD